MRKENAGRTEEVIYQRIIRRADLRANRRTVYVFGDNVQRQGMGGQAREMRGEPNALGIATKWNPGRDDTDYFDDSDPRCAVILMRDIGKLFAAIGTTRVVLPYDGIGTGLSQMPQRAPRLYDTMLRIFQMVGDCPWPNVAQAGGNVEGLLRREVSRTPAADVVKEGNDQ
jgi:hypothetical protein